MQTMLSASAERPAISSRDVTPWARIASLNCAPIDFTGLRAVVALCMTTDMSFQRTAASSFSVSPTMLTPLNVTLPPVMPAGGTSSRAIANSSVDLPQPDSPTIPMNSPGSRSKVTRSTARTAPRSVAYSTERSRAARIGPAAGLQPAERWSTSARALATDPPYRSQGWVADLVEGVIKQGERRAQRGDAGPGRDGPHGLAGLQRRVVLRPVQHRAPALRVGVAQADVLQAGGEQHRVQRVGQEARHDQRGHGGDELHHDDVQPALAAYPGRLQVVPAAHPDCLRPQLPRSVGPPGERDHQDEHQSAPAVRIAGDHD